MRKNDIPAVDDNEVYVWKKADEFAQSWLRDNGYKMSDTTLLDDCIGYSCNRKGVEYAVFFYESDGAQAWFIDVQSSIFAEDYDALYESLVEKYAPTFNEKTLNKVDA